MGKSRAEIELSVSQQQAMAAFRMLAGEFNRMADQMAGSTAKQKRAAMDVDQQFRAWGQSLAKIGLQGLGFMGTLQTIRTLSGFIASEWRAVDEASKRAADRQKTSQQILREIGSMLPRTTDITVEEIDQLARATPDQRTTLLAMRASLSAGQGVSERARVEAAQTVAMARPELRFDEESMTALAAAAQTFAQQFGGDIEGRLAQISIALSEARTEDIQSFSKNIIGAAVDIGKLPFGKQPTGQEVLALLASFTTSANDPEGATSRTNALKSLVQLISDDPRLQAQLQGLGVDSLPGLVQFMQSRAPLANELRRRLAGGLDPTLQGVELESVLDDIEAGRAADFRKKLRGRERTLITQLELISPLDMATGGRDIRTLLPGALARIPTIDQASADFEQRRREMLGSRALTAANVGDALDRMQNAAQMANETAGILGQLGQLAEGLEDVGMARVATRINERALRQFNLGRSPDAVIRSLIDFLETQRTEILAAPGLDTPESRRRESLSTGRLGRIGVSRPVPELTQSQAAALDALRGDLINILEARQERDRQLRSGQDVETRRAAQEHQRQMLQEWRAGVRAITDEATRRQRAGDTTADFLREPSPIQVQEMRTTNPTGAQGLAE